VAYIDMVIKDMTQKLVEVLSFGAIVVPVENFLLGPPAIQQARRHPERRS
jgi:hypothetical protein